MSDTYTKRFIEETFPVKEISEISAKEKNIRHGHISTLHIWWARRPLAASRATTFAALIPFPEDEETIKYFWSVLNPLFNKGILPKTKQTNDVVEAIKAFIIELARWENSNNKDIIETARKMIIHFNDGKPPKTLDPFGGGGSIPLECLRLGCETYSNDLNPVAVLIQKCTLEYPQKYGKPGYVEREVEDFGKKRKEKIWTDNVLLEEVKYWSKWVLEEAKKELAQFYPSDPDGSIPVGYIWSRTIPCQNPACGVEIPLMRQFWLAKKANKKVALYHYIKNKNVEFKIVGDGYEKWPKDYDANEGTIDKANVTCLSCRSRFDANTTRKLFQEKKNSERLIAIVFQNINSSGKKYRISQFDDKALFENLLKYFKIRKDEITDQINIDSIPDEPLPEKGTLGFRVQNYNILTWGDLFNTRQKLSLIIFQNYFRKISDYLEKDYKLAVIGFISCAFGRLLDQSTMFVPWITQLEAVAHTFNRQTLNMVWDYVEASPFIYFESALDWVTRIIEHLSSIPKMSFSPTVSNFSASSFEFSQQYFDSIFTDPPYYDNVPYSYLSDFFYVWHKRVVGSLFPDLFISSLTPKKNEIVAYSHLEGGYEAGKIFFEKMLSKSFAEIHRTLIINGQVIIVYAHKSTEGWETLVNSLLDSGLIITGAWPINTEMVNRLRANDSAALASSIYIVCRKLDRQPTAFYNEVKEETKIYLSKKLDRLWDEGISGADFFIAAIGSSIEVFGKYLSVIDYEGNVIRANKLLEDVRIIVTDYAVKKILHNGFATGISELTRFYVLCRWEFKAAKIPFDEANKLARSCHIELAESWQSKSFIKKDKEFIQILGPQDRDLEDIKDSGELVDVLHHSIKLWEKGKKTEMQKVLNESGCAKSDAFFRVAQAIAETLPNESKEKKLLEGFLNLREKISDGFKAKEDSQGDFFKK